MKDERDLLDKEGQWAYRLGCIRPHCLNDSDFFYSENGGNDGLSAIFSKRAQVPYLKSLFYEACDLYLNFNGNMLKVACNAFSGHSP